MRHVLTRQLYDIWERAVAKVAPELGISDKALRKQCVKHAIPLPDAAYRGRLPAGHALLTDCEAGIYVVSYPGAADTSGGDRVFGLLRRLQMAEQTAPRLHRRLTEMLISTNMRHGF
ncbi:hypothetical protein [Sphingomonas qomolangmaensis]|uniref:Uncharacterized protein n=1 Tax=Sphingomonas qomolangmaensis TaxID=2918765 RepID=A0ABY5LAN5_9SPHN|nr:hypothetical protein [Sphingomonas qomolangmaensis]UUL82937.1 hypothetical protein NMP03_01465 [Sphingomonas qomolangmaensis]